MTQQQVSQMFNEISSSYDSVNRVLSFGIDKAWRKKLIQHLPKGDNLRLLDLATGTGDQLIPLMKSGKVGEAVGIDLAEEMLALGHKKIIAEGYGDQVSMQVASATEIPQKENSFDCVTISFGIRNVQGDCLKEMYRVLIPSGKALILEFSLPKNRLIRHLHLFYLRRVLPTIGGLISGKKSAYRYLNKTIESFPYGDQFLALLEQAGFIQLKAIPLTFGIATLYVGEKP